MDKKEFLKSFQLYVIVDLKLSSNPDLEKVVALAIEGGAQMIQFRDKEFSDEEFLVMAERIKKITQKKNIPLIINDRVNIAKSIDADGVHLGQDDMSLKEAREILGDEKIIGISTHSIEEALQTEKQGADYIGLGSIFQTSSKEIKDAIGTEIIKEVLSLVKIPVFPIGGINLDNLDQVIKAGSKRIAVISAVIAQKDVKKSAEELFKRLKNI
jgi:thiamine-phosphate pyrophosphorylase